VISVVVPTRDRPGPLRACLADLARVLRADDELLVVDSASEQPVVADARVVRANRPGASHARNVGWQAATSDVVAFVDDDVRVAPGWRAALDDALSGVDGVCGRVTVPADQEGVERPVAVTADVPSQLLALEQPLRGVSANLVVRRAALESVGGFDETLGPGTWARAGEDLDLQDRLLLAGRSLRYEPAVLAFHDQWRSRRELLRLDFGYGIGAGARAARRRGPVGRAVLREALWDNGIRPVGHDLRVGYQYGALTGLVRAAGAVYGVTRGLSR
jgi:glycosyltransferase involved in cell wall biosynthesis